MKLKFCFCSLLFLQFVFISSGLSQPEAVMRDDRARDVEIQFRVKWDGQVISGITQVSGLRRITEVITHRNGRDPSIERRSPGITQYEPIILQRPRSGDKAFERWANKVWNFGSGLGTEVSLRDFRKDIRIELYTSSNRVLVAFSVYRCWPSEYLALSDLDADSDALAIEELVLQHEGWERDYSVE